MKNINLNYINLEKNSSLNKSKISVKRMALATAIIGSLMLSSCAKDNNYNNMFKGLEPKAVFGEYEIYDIVEQRGLPCSQMLEIIGTNVEEGYDYYFSCVRSDQVYFVSDNEVIKVKHAYEAGIITLEQLYELGIVEKQKTLIPDGVFKKVLVNYRTK